MKTLAKKNILLTLAFFLLNGCTVYTEKQTEALSQSVYATKDSIDLARIDLASNYIDDATRLVKPPKKRVEIDAIYTKPSATTNSIVTLEKQRVVIVPQEYKNDKVVVVNTSDYDNLLKDKTIAEQLKKDKEIALSQKRVVDEELQRQIANQNKMVNDLNALQKKVIEKDLTILRLWIAVVLLSTLIGIGLYLRFKGGVMF